MGAIGWRTVLGQYVRLSCTVVVAVVLRLTLDAFGIVWTGHDAERENYWFAHCKHRPCVIVGVVELVVCILCSSAFVLLGTATQLTSTWGRTISPALIIGAVEWTPISMFGGKTNMIMGYFIDRANLTSSGFIEGLVFALILNTAAAAFAHFASHVEQEKTLSARGFLNFTRLLMLYAVSWGVGWAYWDSTLRLLSALKTEPPSPHWDQVVIILVVLMSSYVYLRCGPEPVVPQRGPDPFSRSFSRSFASFMVYSSVVVLVMVLSDPAYGFLHMCCVLMYPEYLFPHHTLHGFFLFTAVSIFWTLFSVSVSSQVTRIYGVDMFSSIRLSRQKLASRKAIHMYYEDPVPDSVEHLDNVTISCCLLYDVMVLATACAWGQVVTGGLSLFRPLIEFGAIPYLLITMLYCAALVYGIAWAAMRLCPTMEDLEEHRKADARTNDDSALELYQELSPRGVEHEGLEYFREQLPEVPPPPPPPPPSSPHSSVGRRKEVARELKEFTSESEILLQNL